MSTPSMTTLPLSGLSRPISVLRNTDLPVPDGPSITQISPAGTVSVTSPQMSCLPKDLVRSLTWISTPTFHPPCRPARHCAGPPARRRYWGVQRGRAQEVTGGYETVVTRVSAGDGGRQRAAQPRCGRDRACRDCKGWSVGRYGRVLVGGEQPATFFLGDHVHGCPF